MNSTERRLKKDNPSWSEKEIKLEAVRLYENYCEATKIGRKKRSAEMKKAYNRLMEREQLEWCIIASNTIEI